MDISRKLYIFEEPAAAEHTISRADYWSAIRNIQVKLVPREFVNALLFTSDISLLVVAGLIVFLAHAGIPSIIATEALFLCSYILFIISRASRRLWPSIGMYGLIVFFAALLNLSLPQMWGSVLFYVLCATVMYRFPLRLSLPFATFCVFVLLISEGAWHLLSARYTVNVGLLAFGIGLNCCLAWFGWTRRVQYRLVVQLHEVQEQLREQMKRSEELAAERERMRIARDIHDVLSHSLAVLSIQVQASRQLVARDPERLTGKLDDMASLIRESITESRRVVGLLRDTPVRGQNDTSVSLQMIVATFNERTGIHCRFDENGTAHMLTQPQKEALQQALRESLTNAHRHGAAHSIWITLRWREASLVLEVRDNGLGAKAGDLFANLTGKDVGNHHGLQGIRERAEMLGGEVEAGPLETGGFSLILRLPYEQSNERFVQKV